MINCIASCLVLPGLEAKLAAKEPAGAVCCLCSLFDCLLEGGDVGGESGGGGDLELATDGSSA